MSTGAYQKQINRSGEALLKAVNGLTQIAKIHLDNNEMLLDAVRKFVRLIQKLDDGQDRISIHLVDGRFYFQEHRLILSPANAQMFNRMVRFFVDRNLLGLRIAADMKQTTPEKIIAFFRLIDQAARHDDPSDWLSAKLLELDIHWVALADELPKLPGEDTPNPDELAARKASVRKSYANVLGSVKDIAHKLCANQSVGLRSTVRLVQKMVDLIQKDEALFIGISTIRIYDDYTYTHSLNVAILSMCLGNRIGLNRTMLERLGMCGLFHDLGKVEIPKALLNKKSALSSEEYATLKLHSMHSARLILKMKARGERKNKILVPPFEHHMGYDRSGYPAVSTGPRISLFGRILTIADVYDAITSPRVYRKEAMSPDKALAKMMAQSGTHFDPILLKVFCRMLGHHPIGTLVKLDNGEIGIVTHPGRPHHNGPMVQLLVQDAKKSYRKGVVVDLSERDSKTGHCYYNIAATLHPSVIGVQPAEFIL